MLCALMAAALVTGCGGGSNGAPANPDLVPPAPDAGVDAAEDATGDAILATTTYHGEAQTILDERCVLCHKTGGGAPFSMTWNEDEWADGPAWWTGMAMAAIAEGRMPPWQPASGCRPIQHDLSLLPEEKAVLESWQAEGFARGEVSSDPGPVGGDPDTGPEPTIVTDAGAAYVADRTAPDDYRCFLLDTTFETDRFVTQSDVWPGARDVVHHVILYRVLGEDVDDVETLDDADGGLGYRCFGGPGVEAEFVGGWAPGAKPFAFPKGSAMQVMKGSRIVMQLHYNTSYLDADAEVPEDLTQMALWLLPEGETPADLVSFRSFANREFLIPANEPSSTHVMDEPFLWNSHVVGVVPHMHNLGTEIRASILDESGGEACLFDIRSWDFNWQQLYLFEDGEEVFVHGLSQHRMTCSYDNSPENQPVVNGVQSDPTHVVWGDGTSDEMCLNFALLKFPYQAMQHKCGNYTWCAKKCDGDFGCVYGCALGSGEECGSCLSDAYVACGQEHCAADTATALQCAQACGEDGQETIACLMGTCRDDWQVVHDCVGPAMDSGACDAHLGPCDLGP
jgi:hypothetical protein